MIKLRHIGNCLKADPACVMGVAGALGIALDKTVEARKKSRFPSGTGTGAPDIWTSLFF